MKITIDTETLTPEERELLSKIINKEVKPKPDKDGYCSCKDDSQVTYYQFGGGHCRRCGGHAY